MGIKKNLFDYNKKGDLELDELGKLIIGLILLIILIVIVTVFIGGDLSSQGNNVVDVFNKVK